jgi:putative tryptophan/tyrosine transport system substrate-binding protein
MASHNERRKFLVTLGGAAVVWLLAARAQQPAMPVVGFLRSSSLADSTVLVTAFRNGLRETGFVEGQNVAIEYHYADNQIDRLPGLVANLIRQPVAVIVGNAAPALAAKSATTTVPIVFVTGGDPVEDGFVASMNRPGGNVTGVSFFGSVVGAKRLEMLRQLVPRATTIAVLVTRTKLIPRLNEKTCRLQRLRSGNASSFWMPAASATSIRALQRSSNAEPVRCSPVAALS